MIKKQILDFLSNNKFIVLIALVFLYTIPIFQEGFYIGHDNESQVARIAARITALTDGQFPPRWAGNLNYGYGHPGLIFYYSLSDYMVSLIYFLGFSLENSYEILTAATFILAPVFFYLWSSQFFKNKSAFLASIFYGLAPYSFLNVYVRGHLGESLALALIPLTLYFIERNFKSINLGNIIIGGISYALLIQSHSILSFIFSFVFSSYIFFKCYGRKKLLILGLAILFIGILLSAYFWIPAIYEGKYINNKILLSGWYKEHFLSLSNIAYSPWGFGSNVNEQGGLSVQIGPLHVIFVALSIGILFKKTKGWKDIAYWLSIFLGGIFMSTSLSDFLWAQSHFLKQFQFPWRFIAVGSFSAAVLTGYVAQKINSRKLYTTVIISLLLLSIPMARVWRSDNKGDDYYFNYPGSTAYHNEATTIWTAGDAYRYPESPIEVISGNAQISNIIRRSARHSFIVDAKTDAKILDNTVYFPGWQARVNGKKTPIEFQDMNHRGLITFSLPQGIHAVEVVFRESPIRLLADSVSLGTFLLIIGVILMRKKIGRVLIAS